MIIDYSKIVTDNFKLLVSDERKNEIKNEALVEKGNIMKNNAARQSKPVFYKKAIEAAYVAYRHKEKKSAEKALLAANIAFDEDKFAEILLKGGFNKNNLETFMKLLGFLKSKIANDTIESIDEKYIKTAEKYASLIKRHFVYYVGTCDINLIINKINDILSYNSELLEENKNNLKRG